MRCPLVISLAILTLFGCGFLSSESETPSGSPRVASSAAQPAASARICDESTAVLIGQLYYLSSPLNEWRQFASLEEFVTRNRHLLSSESRFAACARQAGSRVSAQALLNYSQADADAAYEGALGMGATMDQARAVGASMTSGSVEAAMMGEEFVWLSQVIPSAAAGNWTSYGATGPYARQQARQAIQMLEMMLRMDPDSAAMVQQTLQQTMQEFQPWIVYQAAVLIMMTGV